jgi:hypothetical protein
LLEAVSILSAVNPKGGIDMAAGADAVKDALRRAFGSVPIKERLNSDLDTVFDFSAKDRDFTVRVTREFDKDYASGQIRIDFAQLGPFLLASKDGKATVSSGISN